MQCARQPRLTFVISWTYKATKKAPRTLFCYGLTLQFWTTGTYFSEYSCTMLDLMLSFTWTHLSTLGVAAVVFLVFCYFISTKNTKRGKLPPGPMGVPLYGNLLDIKRSDMNGPGILDKWAAEFGDIYSLRFGPYDVVVLNSPELVREAFLKNGDATSGRPTNVFFFGTLLGKAGIGLNEGQEWKDMRRTALHSLRDFGMGKKSMEERIQEEARALVAAIDQNNGQAFEPRMCLNNAFSNVICSIIFGDRYEYEDPEFAIVARNLSTLFLDGGFKNPELYVPILTPLIPILNRSLFGAYKASSALQRYIKDKVKQHEEAFDPNDVKSFIDIYINATRSGELNEGRKENLMISILDLFLAGSETSTTSLLWALLYLIHYPDVQARCRRDIAEVIGQVRAPTNNDRSKLIYIEATIQESQRMGSIVAYGALHRTMEDVEISGYEIPTDTLIVPNLYHLHMDSDYWGNPEVFRPDRWLGEDGKLIKHDHFMPFSIGPRECMGKSLALQEMFIVFVSLLQKFTFTAKDPDDLPRISGTMGITYSPESFHIIANRN